MVSKNFLVVSYDISNNNRRNKICKILSGCGQRVNFSVFECFLSEKDIEKMKKSIEQNIKKGKDIILYYNLCGNCIEKVERIGIFREESSITQVF